MKNISSTLLLFCLFNAIAFAQNIPDSLKIDKEKDLSGIEVTAERNPAYYIMEKVLANKDKNNYEKYKSYTYTAYDKFYIPIDWDSIPVDSLKGDDAEIIKKLSEMYLFFMENISDGKFMAPDFKKETVTASRISGIRNPVIDIILAQYQVNSFYSDYITVFNARYLSPLNKESILTWKSKYYFNIEDTIIRNVADTLFVISYRPVMSSVFSGLSGELHVNSTHWALEQIHANIYKRNEDEKKFFNIDFVQTFEFLKDSLWFPTYTKTDVFVSAMVLVRDTITNTNRGLDVFARSERLMNNVDFDTEIRKRDFNNVMYSTDPDAYFRSEKYWDEHRPAELDSKAEKTYVVLDSLDKEYNITRKMDALTTVFFGKFSLWKFDIPLNRFVNYNQHEGFSLGLGAETNHRLSKVFKVGGYYRYGFKDKASKWGAYTQVRLHRESNWLLDLAYSYDIQEAGGKPTNRDISLFNPEYFRNFLINRVDIVRNFSAETSVNAFKHFRFALGLRNDKKTPCYDYYFHEVKHPDYNFTVAHFGIRFAYKEKFYTTKYGLMSMGTKFPIVKLDYERGISGFIKGEYNFNKLRLSIDGNIPVKDSYKFSFFVEGGYIDADVPYTELFNCAGAYYKFTLFSPHSFATMRLNEFVSDKYVSAFLRFDFVKFFDTGVKWFKPKPSICFNYGLGTLDNSKIASHSGIDIKTMEKGFYEAGLNINGLLDVRIYSIGFGVFYRFGEYSMPTVRENFAYKLTLSLPLTLGTSAKQ